MKNIFLLLLFLIIIQCNKSENLAQPESVMSPMAIIEDDKVAAMTDASPEAPPPPQEVTPKKIDTVSKKVIKNGNMTIQVGDIKKAHQQVNKIIKNNKAYVQTEEF